MLHSEFGAGGALFAGKRGQGVGDVGQNVEQIALFGVDDFLHLRHLIVAETFLGQAFQEFSARVGGAPERAEFGFVFEKLGELAEEQSP